MSVRTSKLSILPAHLPWPRVLEDTSKDSGGANPNAEKELENKKLDLGLLAVAALKVRLKEHKLPSTGNKAALVDRLLAPIYCVFC